MVETEGRGGGEVLGEGAASLLSISEGVNGFSRFWPLKNASPEQKVSRRF